ncbi:MAG: LamG domain-containing protein [Planctomycetota bacterium]
MPKPELAQEATPRAAPKPQPAPTPGPLRHSDYSHAFWPNGFRREKGDSSAHVFCVESGRYGFALDTADFSAARFGLIDGPGYGPAVATASRSLTKLAPAALRIEIERGGRTYRAVDCLAGRLRDARHAIMLESGRFAQRYRFTDLRFEDAGGAVLETASSLELTAWPSSMTFALSAAPDLSYENGPCPGLVGGARVVRGEPVDVPHRPELDPGELTLELWVKVPQKLAHLNRHHWLIGKNRNEWHEGCFGLMCNRQNITAVLNVGGGRGNFHRLDRHGVLKPDRWHHVALSYDGETLRLYVNGGPAGSKRVGRARTPGKDRLRIGGRPDGHGKPVNALFDEVRIWDRALKPAEIRAHSRSPAKFSRKGLSWRMSFDEDAGAAADAGAPDLAGATVRMALGEWKAEEAVAGPWKLGEKKTFVLHCPVGDEAWREASVKLTATGDEGMTYPAEFDPATGAFVIDVPEFKRDWKTGYTDIRNYDEVALEVENESGVRHHVPVLFDVKKPAQITGQTPILCDAEGRPTGIPVQLSKNWHHGAYSKFYAIIPADPGSTRYRLRIAYGFWGSLPAASHAQLSLFGYGGNGRWDQLAIGCWGETMCFDVENSLTPMMITDVRMLMTRNGKTGKKWNWTDGGWGGDWLGVFRAPETKIHPVELKTAYLAHGPCLTDVRYGGYYGKGRDVAFDARVATLRTDDYNRVFQRFSYRFASRLPTAGAHLFKMGPNRNLLTPRIAWGNRDGLIEEREVRGALKPKSVFARADLTGPAPWWVAFPGSYFRSTKDWGTGSRGLVIRSFKAKLGGKVYDRPSLSFPVQLSDRATKLSGLDLELVPPPGVEHFMPGDTIEMYVEWITVPREADDYYGPNEAFRSHLAENPRSWKTVHREAKGNDLRLAVTGGSVLQEYPIVIATDAERVEVAVSGGVGVVPIRFEGLASVDGLMLHRKDGDRLTPLDQSVNGNDFWQTDYDAESRTYRMTFNLPLDGVAESTWVLAQRSGNQ